MVHKHGGQGAALFLPMSISAWAANLTMKYNVMGRILVTIQSADQWIAMDRFLVRRVYGSLGSPCDPRRSIEFRGLDIGLDQKRMDSIVESSCGYRGRRLDPPAAVLFNFSFWRVMEKMEVKLGR
jgi:hypothetical protein